MTATKLFFFPRALTPSGPGRRAGGRVEYRLVCAAPARPEATTLPPTMTNKALYSAAATAADGRMMGQLADERREVPIVALPQLTPSPLNTTPFVFPYAIHCLTHLAVEPLSRFFRILAGIKYENCAVKDF